MNNISVMTFNMKSDMPFTSKIKSFQNRKYCIENIINKYCPDIIGVQELTMPMKYELKSLLNSYDFFGYSRYSKDCIFNEHTDILVKKDKFQVSDHGTFWLSNDPLKAGSKFRFSIFPRICTYTNITDLSSGISYKIFNSHLDHLLESNRLKQSSILLKELYRQYSTNPCPTIVMGDFNCRYNSPVIKFFKNHKLPLKDIYQNSSLCNTFHFSKGTKVENKSPIDYIFVSQDFCINKINIISDTFNGIYPSDHFPVLANLSYIG